ncbi:MAG: hypothetical protein GX362_05750 [Methanosarcinaceae archaeon]|nr:hypothetical protein [Methanosarcinaceae archaeon]
MHEYSLAADMMEVILNVAHENSAKQVNEVVISIGLLAHASPVQLEFCLKSIGEGTIAENAKYVFKESKSDVNCACGYKKTISGIPDFPENDNIKSSYDALLYLSTISCPKCGERLVLENADTILVDSIDID